MRGLLMQLQRSVTGLIHISTSSTTLPWT